MSGALDARNAPSARKSIPPDLAAFIAARSVRAAADALGVSHGTVQRLRAGYWPERSERITDAWAACVARRASAPRLWFIRRVYAPGVIDHARAHWIAPELAERIGEYVACTRAPDGALLAQTLDLPAERFVLALVADQ